MLDPLREFDKDILPKEPGSLTDAAVDEVSELAEDTRLAAGALPGDSAAIRSTRPIESSQEIAHVAVVFVHGMGSSRPGDMLESYMNPSLEWIKRATTDDHTWYLNNDLDTNLIEGVNILDRDRKPGSSPATRTVQAQVTSGEHPSESPTLVNEVDIGTIRNALLHSTETTPAIFQPPYMDVDLVLRSGEEAEVRKMVAVEAWWDGEFAPPPFRQVAQWALGVAPSLILRHLALVWEMDPGTDETSISTANVSARKPVGFLQRVGNVFGALTFTLVGGFMAMLFQWIICMLLGLGAIPVLQKYVSTLILKMTTSFGDVLTYVHDGVRSSAIRSTVLRAFLWLSTNYKVEKLIVVSHSLGTVISYDVLNSRDFLRKVTEQDVSFVTFGSPLKKANILLHLKRDEQRVSLGMLFAMLSFACAVAAAIVGTYRDPLTEADPLGRSEWLFILSTGIGAVLIGIGSHARPILWRVPATAYTLCLSAMQYLGVLLSVMSAVILIIHTNGFGRILPILMLIGVLVWTLPVSFSRISFDFDARRPSQSLGFGIALLIGVGIAAIADVLPLAASLLLAALILSIMTAANPLEEFRQQDDRFQRQLPKFAFGTPIKQWIDFWATNDLVAEYGLGDVRYRTTAEGEFDSTPKSRRITNMKSFVIDHTTYRNNLEQFIAPLTRLFLEEIGFRGPSRVAAQNLGAIPTMIGLTPIQGNYEQDMANAMRTRPTRIRWLSWAGGLLLLTTLLFSPSVYRSIGEFIVFDERNPVSLSGTGEPIVAPVWFTTFYNREPKVCGEILCRIRHLPLLPNDVSETLIRNNITGSVILYGFGYGIAFLAATLFTRMFLTIPWKAWEAAILDTLLHKKSTLSFNRFVRALMFFTVALLVVALAVAVNNPWFGLTWVWDNELAPLHSLQALGSWLLAPFISA